LYPSPCRPARLSAATGLRAVLHVLYLIFNEGYAATQGDQLTRPDLSGEAIRLARWLHRLLPGDPEVTGLLALMLLTEARRPARTSPDGELVPLAEQQRNRWDRALIAEGVDLITADAGCLWSGRRRPHGRGVPAAGRDRRGARRGGERGRDRLAADPRPVRPAGPGRPEPARAA